MRAGCHLDRLFAITDTGQGGYGMSPSILVVDDEPTMRQLLEGFLEDQGYRVATVGSGREAVARIEAQAFDVVVADIRLPDVSGLAVLERSRSLNPAIPVVVMTGHATLDTAVEALRRGACDFLQKPFRLDDLARCLRRLLGRRAADGEPAEQEGLPCSVGETLVGESPAMRALKEQIARCAPMPSNVLITGESGTGKELVACAIHAASPRREAPFVPVNCGAIPEALLESQLFGHVKGAFTSAVQANPGLFVAAHGGTLFLDEIAELPFLLQVKLLRVLEERQVWAVGASKPVAVDVRVIASTNRDLSREIEAQRFRADLFYRLDVVHLHLPALRERRSDIPLLVDHFIRRLNVRLSRRVQGIDPGALHVLVNHGWKGNVRELENLIERAMILGEGEAIQLDHLFPDREAVGLASGPANLRVAVRRFEREHIEGVLARTRRDKRRAARLLGISLASLYRKLTGGPLSDSGEPR
jgi:DNA-binding NtrC family response regulator